MTSSIITSTIDTSYPVEGEDNSSVGFYDNWAAIKLGLDTAAVEITYLQDNPGFTGSRGDTGFVGSAGTNGSNGFNGSQGDLGFVGSQGAPGGPQGPSGPQGPLGYTGSEGVGSGTPGYTGSAGSGYTGSASTAVGYTGSAAASSGDVVGPASSTANCIAIFDDTTGKLLRETTASITDAGAAAFAPGVGVAVTLTAAAATSALVSNGAARTPAVLAASGTTVNIDCSLSNVFYTNVGHNIATINLNNPTDGQTINWFIIRPSSTNYTVALPTSLLWADGIDGTITTGTTGSVDLLVATYLSTTSKWYVTLLTNFS